MTLNFERWGTKKSEAESKEVIMFCPQCGNNIKEEAKFCSNCGWAIPITTVQAVVMPIGKQCSSCGTALKDEAQFCPNCGQAVVSADISESVIKRRTAFRITVGFALLTVGILIIISVAFTLIKPVTVTNVANSNNNTQQPNTPSNTETLTYYVNGDKKTANVEYLGFAQFRYSYDAGRNVIGEVSYQTPGENWTNWEQFEFTKNPQAYTIEFLLLANTNFYSAVEVNVNGDWLIFIYQKNNSDGIDQTQFIKQSGDYVYTLAKVYMRM